MEAVDLSALDDYADTIEEYQDFCDAFFEQTEHGLKKLENFCLDGQVHEWVEITHQIKGSAAMVGANVLSRYAAEGQMMADASAEQRKEKYAQMLEAYDEAKRLLQGRINGS